MAIKSRYPNIIYVEGDLLESHRDGVTVIGHQCSCRHAWRAGIHRQIAERFPEVLQEYLSRHGDPGDMRIFVCIRPEASVAE